MVNVSIPQAGHPLVDERGVITRPWQRFFAQLYIRTGKEADLVETGVNTGDLKATAKTTAPTGWLICDGSAISRSTYANLFTAIGTAYGAGNGSTTFNIPDGRGRALIGAGTGSGLTARSLGDSGGAETHTLVLTETPLHGHSLNNAGVLVTSNVGTEYEAAAGTKGTIEAVTTNQAGGDQPHNNMQPFFVGNWIIKT